MTIQTTTKTLPPVLNSLAVVAQSSHDLLVEVEKTKEVYAQHVKASQETISSQAEQIQRLKAELESVQQRDAREMEVLRGAHAAEIATYVAAVNNKEVEIVTCVGRINKFANEINNLRAIFYRGGVRARLTPAEVANARAILDRALNI